MDLGLTLPSSAGAPDSERARRKRARAEKSAYVPITPPFFFYAWPTLIVTLFTLYYGYRVRRDYRFRPFPPNGVSISGVRPVRAPGRRTPVGRAASSPLRSDFAAESATTARFANSSRVPSVRRPRRNGAEPPADRLTPIDTASSPLPVERPRGRPRRPDEVPGGEIGDFDDRNEPEPETIVSALRDLGTVMPFVRLQPVFTYW